MDPYTALVAISVLVIFGVMEIYDMRYNEENEDLESLPGDPDITDEKDDDYEEVRIVQERRR